jgi:hypothetical protein
MYANNNPLAYLCHQKTHVNVPIKIYVHTVEGYKLSVGKRGAPWTLKQEMVFSMNLKKCASQVLRREDSYTKSLRMGRILHLKVTNFKN